VSWSFSGEAACIAGPPEEDLVGDQAFVQQLLDSTYPIMNTSSSPYYLPTFMKQNGYDPYGPFEWTLANLTDPTLLNAAAGICPAISIQSTPCQADPFYISATPPPYPSLQLTNSTIVGMSNCAAERPIAGGGDGRQITMQMDFSTLPNLASAVTLNGLFVFTQYCSCSKDGKTPDGPGQQEIGRGSYTATIPSSNMVIQFAITNLATNVLTIAVTSVAFNIPNASDGGPNMSISINITSIPPGVGRDAYNNVAMTAFGNPGSRAQILAQINVAMNLPSILQKVGNVLTQEIDGYLQANHRYPFGDSFSALI
jgi:hypothetical protein